MSKAFTDDDDALLAELGVEVEEKGTAGRTPREERIITGFEEIQRFVEKHGHPPRHGEGRDIFERLYAVRLDRIREQEECRALVEPLDHQDLLAGSGTTVMSNPGEMDDDALLAELGVENDNNPITELRHVRSSTEKRAAEEIANRERCADFETFRPLFEQVQKELDSGARETRPFELKAEIQPGRFFIVGGQKAYVAKMGETTITEHGRTDARLRVIFDNGTESNMLMRSLQR
ncbi:MAG: GIY-YIG nuclease family protein, partial [Hyphomicrobiaceae bacterium]|nr:GIY-YIG nuclease family protein [Hyphomicrobiaceae bacterium]